MGKEDNWSALMWLLFALLCVALIGAVTCAEDAPPPAPFEEWVGEDEDRGLLFGDNPGPGMHWDPVTQKITLDDVALHDNADAGEVSRLFIICQTAEGNSIDDKIGCLTWGEQQFLWALWDSRHQQATACAQQCLDNQHEE